jgi:hypothetical protein
MEEKRWKEKWLGKKKEYESGNPRLTNFFFFSLLFPPYFLTFTSARASATPGGRGTGIDRERGRER